MTGQAAPNPALALARAQLQSTRASLCGHGVRRANCKEDHEIETEESHA